MRNVSDELAQAESEPVYEHGWKEMKKFRVYEPRITIAVIPHDYDLHLFHLTGDQQIGRCMNKQRG